MCTKNDWEIKQRHSSAGSTMLGNSLLVLADVASNLVLFPNPVYHLCTPIVLQSWFISFSFIGKNGYKLPIIMFTVVSVLVLQMDSGKGGHSYTVVWALLWARLGPLKLYLPRPLIAIWPLTSGSTLSWFPSEYHGLALSQNIIVNFNHYYSDLLLFNWILLLAFWRSLLCILLNCSVFTQVLWRSWIEIYLSAGLVYPQ